MKEKIIKFKDKFLQSQLLGGSLIMFIGTMVSSFGTYLYHPVMGRMLGPINYGVLSSLISLTYWLAIPVGVMNLVVVKYTSALKEEKGLSAVAIFYNWIQRKLVVFGILFFLFWIIVSPLIASFLHVSSILPLVFIVSSSFIGFFSGLNTATFQGFLRFDFVSLVTILNSYLKLFFGIFLVWLGFQVNGATLSLLVGTAAVFIISHFLVNRLLGNRRKDQGVFAGSDILNYSFPVLIYTISFTSFYTLDILLVRHFLPTESGFYAALALLGKIIVFATAPIGSVMFPVISGRTAKGKSNKKVLIFGFLMVLAVSLMISLIYCFFPEVIIKIPFGEKYLGVSSELKFFAIFLTLYSLCGVMVNYYLASFKTKIINLTLVAAVAQALLIWLFHSSIHQIVIINILVMSLLLIGLSLPLVGNWQSGVK